MHTIQLFVTCLLDTLYPDTAEAVVDVLEHAGVRVECPPGQTCCGQPAFNAGMRDEARRVARHTIRTFEHTAGPVVVPSGSCAAMIKRQYPELFADDSHWLPRAQALADRTMEFTQFLVDDLGILDLGAVSSQVVTYHPSCHLLRELGVDRQPRLLLEKVQQLEVRALPHAEECCGFGGVFSLEYPEVSAAMMERKMTNIEATGAQRVVACDAGCITHLNGGFHRRGSPLRAVHIAEVLCQRRQP